MRTSPLFLFWLAGFAPAAGPVHAGVPAGGSEVRAPAGPVTGVVPAAGHRQGDNLSRASAREGGVVAVEDDDLAADGYPDPGLRRHRRGGSPARKAVAYDEDKDDDNPDQGLRTPPSPDANCTIVPAAHPQPPGDTFRPPSRTSLLRC
jgi:hypothetical protein